MILQYGSSHLQDHTTSILARCFYCVRMDCDPKLHKHIILDLERTTVFGNVHMLETIMNSPIFNVMNLSCTISHQFKEIDNYFFHATCKMHCHHIAIPIYIFYGKISIFTHNIPQENNIQE